MGRKLGSVPAARMIVSIDSSHSITDNTKLFMNNGFAYAGGRNLPGVTGVTE